MPDLDQFDNLPLGALVISVTEGSPAERAGLEVGNVITAIDDVSLDDQEDLAVLIGERDPGDTVQLTLGGVAGDTETLKVTLGRHPDRGGETAYLGITYRMVPLVEFDRMPFRGR
jgi:serine protease Do